MVKSHKLVHKQEIELYSLIPAIRKALFLKMKSNGLDQKEIANLLGVTASAISQYSSKKRANDIKLTPEIKNEISHSADRIMSKQTSSIEEIQRILSLQETRELVCSLHKKYGCVPAECRACMQCFR